MKIIQFVSCTPWCPYSTRHTSDSSFFGRHHPNSRIACIITSVNDPNHILKGHIRSLTRLDLDKCSCYLPEIK
jgi:hypothetical protein